MLQYHSIVLGSVMIRIKAKAPLFAKISLFVFTKGETRLPDSQTAEVQQWPFQTSSSMIIQPRRYLSLPNHHHPPSGSPTTRFCALAI